MIKIEVISATRQPIFTIMNVLVIQIMIYMYVKWISVEGDGSTNVNTISKGSDIVRSVGASLI